MNTHDKIKLPPNPITPMLAVLIDKASGAGTAETIWQLMQEFANQAIEAAVLQSPEVQGLINFAQEVLISVEDGGTLSDDDIASKAREALGITED